MINREMNKNANADIQGNQQRTPMTKPNELGGIYFSSSVKIFDPETNKVILHKRGDA
jgi:hypothetical protein